MKKCKLRKVYGAGGSLVGPIAGAATTILDGFTPSDRPAGIGLSAAKGLAGGVAAGAALGPWGAVAGGVLGAVSGALTGAKQKKQAEREEVMAQMARERNFRNYSAAALVNDPSLAYGNRNTSYYADGGKLRRLNPLAGTKAMGGHLRPVSSRHTEVVGPSHANGGVQLPAYNAEVEGEETTSGEMVFSKDLGFADLHRPIAKAIGKIEVKPATPERINALKRLSQREQELYQLQEQLKAYSHA